MAVIELVVPPPFAIAAWKDIIWATHDWVRTIHEHPGWWASPEQETIIKAVLWGMPGVRMAGEDCSCGSGACGPEMDWSVFRG